MSVLTDLFCATTTAGAREKASRQSKKKLLLASQCKRRKGEVHGSPAVEAKEVAPAFWGEVPGSAYEEGPRKFVLPVCPEQLYVLGLAVGGQ